MRSGGLNLVFGVGATLLMMIPVLNLAAMPATVIGATILWQKQEDFAKDNRRLG